MHGARSAWTRPKSPRAWAAVIAGGVLLLALLLGSVVRRQDRGGGEALFATVRSGSLAVDINAVGELQAVRSLSFGVPRLRSNAAKIVWLVPEGSTVAPGDTLVRFDPTEVQRRLEDLEGRLVSARANREKLRASQSARTAELLAQLEDQQAALRLAEIGAENVQYEARIEQEKAQLALQRAKLDVDQTKSKLEAQRSIDDAEITEQRVSLAQLENQLAAERDAFANHTLLAPTSGLVVYGTIYTGSKSSKVKIGDQVYYGGVVLELPDLSAMRIATWVNESRVDQLREGQPCEIRIDAFPDTSITGRVGRINVLGRELPESEGVKVFDFDVLIDGNDRRLRPGMTATVTVHVARLDSIVYAPIEAVHVEDGAAWVMRARGRGVERVPVTVGLQNDFHVAILSGVQPGDRLALRTAGDAGAE